MFNHDHLPRKSLSLHNYINRTMAKQRVFKIYLKSIRTVYSQYIILHDTNPTIYLFTLITNMEGFKADITRITSLVLWDLSMLGSGIIIKGGMRQLLTLISNHRTHNLF